MGYGYFEESAAKTNYFNKLATYRTFLDSTKIQILKIEHQRKKIINISNLLSKRNSIKNPVTENDSIIKFQKVLNGNGKEVAVSDSLSKLWNEADEALFNLELLNKQIDIYDKNITEAKNEYDSTWKDFTRYFWVGALIVFFGLHGIINGQKIQDELLRRQLFEKQKGYKHCQSCGKRFSPIRQISKNKDGTLNLAFCSDCYENGAFTDPELTNREFHRRSLAEIKKRRTWLVKKLLFYRLSNLERWNDDEYF